MNVVNIACDIGSGKTDAGSALTRRLLEMARTQGPKRPSPPQVDLPKVSQYVVERLGDHLKQTSESIRTPLATAAVLVLMVEMWQSDPKVPFPARQQVADHLGVSLPAVDVVLSSRQDTGDICIEYVITRGNVAGRHHSSIRQRFIVPADWLIDFVNMVKEEEALAEVAVKQPAKRKRKVKELIPAAVERAPVKKAAAV